MLQTESHPTAANTLQSIRSSCNRCRLLKLKCTVQATDSDGHMVCERCVRAKVPCVFGRRRRASRPSEAKKRTDTSTRRATVPPVQQDPAVLTPPLSASASTSDLVALGVATPSSLAAAAAPPETPLERLETLAECEPEAPPPTYHAHQPWESLAHGFGSTAGGIEGQQGGGGGMIGWDWSDHGFSPDELYCLDPELPGATPPSASSGYPMPSHYPTEGVATAMRDNSRMTASVADRRLPALIAEMQQRLETLENGSWLHDNARSFDRYPIGAVLRLSQEFGALAGQVLGITMGCGADATNPNVYPAGLLAPGKNNTATVLLVLCGYFLLVRLHGLVLGHFHAQLNRIPSASLGVMATGHAGRVATASPTLQLGELPSDGAMPDISRIHAALGMLLTALHEVEEQLGQGGEIARDMVVTQLTQGSGLEPVELQEALGGLGEKVRSVKKLLREKMGL